MKSWLVIFTIANKKSMENKIANNVTVRTKRASDNPEFILEHTFIFNEFWKREIMLLLFLFRGESLTELSVRKNNKVMI